MARPSLAHWGVALGTLVFLAATSAEAETHLGVWGGASLFDQHYSELDESVSSSTRASFTGGLALDVDLGSSVWIRFAPGWVEKGTTIEGEIFDQAFSADLKLGYVELPVLFGVTLTSGSVRPYVLGGPSGAYLARAKASADGAGEEDVKEFFEKWDFGLSAGGGLALGSGRTQGFVEGRYTWGLVNANTEEDDSTILKNRGWQITAGVMVTLGR